MLGKKSTVSGVTVRDSAPLGGVANSLREVDEPGLWHHVCTRALARRPYFEVGEDYRFLGEMLGEAVAESRIEVHSYCFMTNHFHVLLRSLDGRLSETMRDTLAPYSKWFNKRRDRDGPLVKSRFFSRVVHGLQDRFVVTRYIDQNPVKANIADSIFDYEHSSARHIAFGTGPEWLSRSDVEETVRAVMRSDRCDPDGYLAVFGGPASETADWLVEHRLGSRTDQTEVLDQLLGQPETVIQKWLLEATQLADGAQIGYALAPAPAILAAIARLRKNEGEWKFRIRSRSRDACTILCAGLMKLGSFCTIQQIASRLNASRGTAERWLRDHRFLMRKEPEYRARAARILHSELQTVLPGRYLRKRTFFLGGKMSSEEECTTS